jgi:hypothetical protein
MLAGSMELRALIYFICGVPSIILNIMAWSFLGKEKFSVVVETTRATLQELK